MNKMGRKVVFITLVMAILFSTLTMASIIGNTMNDKFYDARKDRSAVKMLAVIKAIEAIPNYDKDPMLLTVLADCYLEYADWGVPSNEKEEKLTKARSLAEAAIKLDPSNGRAHYIAGASIGRLAQYKGIVQSLFMLGDLDKYIDTAIKLLDENDEEGRLYKTFAYIASGMRYRDVPWPLYNYKKSEELLNKALQLTPDYPNIYLELGYLYLKTGDKDKAKEMFKKVTTSPANPKLVGTHNEAKKIAKDELDKLK